VHQPSFVKFFFDEADKGIDCSTTTTTMVSVLLQALFSADHTTRYSACKCLNLLVERFVCFATASPPLNGSCLTLFREQLAGLKVPFLLRECMYFARTENEAACFAELYAAIEGDGECAPNCRGPNYPEISMYPPLSATHSGFDVQTVMGFEHLVRIFRFMPILRSGERVDSFFNSHSISNSHATSCAQTPTYLDPFPSAFLRHFCRSLCGFPFRPDSQVLAGTLHMLLAGAGTGASSCAGAGAVNADVRQFVLNELFSADLLMAGLETVLLRLLLPLGTKNVCECVRVYVLNTCY
jgi:hypothetical protein